LVREAEEAGVDLSALPFSSFSAAHPAFAEDVLAELAPERSLSHRDIAGGTGPASVQQQLAEARRLVGE
jgi:argininosuccinate lyase